MQRVTIDNLNAAQRQVQTLLDEIMLDRHTNGATQESLDMAQRFARYEDQIQSLYLAVDANGTVDPEEIGRCAKWVQEAVYMPVEA